MLRGRKIIIGVCGSIAAYKTAVLIRLLKKSGAEVKVIMTTSAQSFITPLTLATLSENPVLSSFQKDESGQWNNHVELGLWADLLLIAPATANTIGKLAHGIADNLLNAVYLSARCPVALAPAMDLDMYRHSSVKESLEKLKAYGNIIIDAEYGELASGLVGEGRMAEPEHLVQFVEGFFNDNGKLKKKKVLITAGPTFEPIDPVRFIGNHSSGKMGLELAKQASLEGAEVTLVIGPNHLDTGSLPGIDVVSINSAAEMYDACDKRFGEQDIVIFAAAVADYKPTNVADQKLKKTSDTMELPLIKTVDVARELGKKKSKQFSVGFALETENEEVNAKEKLQNKNFDMIVLNSLRDEGAGFQHETNKVKIIHQDNNLIEYELKSKTEVAKDIINEIAAKIA